MNNLPKVLKTGLNVLFCVCLAATIGGSASNMLNHYGIMAARYQLGGIFAIVVSIYTYVTLLKTNCDNYKTK